MLSTFLASPHAAMILGNSAAALASFVAIVATIGEMSDATVDRRMAHYNRQAAKKRAQRDRKAARNHKGSIQDNFGSFA